VHRQAIRLEHGDFTALARAADAEDAVVIDEQSRVSAESVTLTAVEWHNSISSRKEATDERNHVPAVPSPGFLAVHVLAGLAGVENHHRVPVVGHRTGHGVDIAVKED
jgi:hypothetical protein